jgi:hypothetical protein
MTSFHGSVTPAEALKAHEIMATTVIDVFRDKRSSGTERYLIAANYLIACTAISAVVKTYDTEQTFVIGLIEADGWPDSAMKLYKNFDSLTPQSARDQSRHAYSLAVLSEGQAGLRVVHPRRSRDLDETGLIRSIIRIDN